MRIGFIGCGKMGGALLGGLLESGVCDAEDVRVAVRSESSLTTIREMGLADSHISQNGADAVRESDVILLCVKPHDAISALENVREALKEKLLISVVAGLKIEALQKAAGDSVRIIRVMPNTPSLIGEGMSVFAVSETTTGEDAKRVEEIFEEVGDVARVEKESLLDAVTGVSGSGPAYVFTMIEALADGGVRMGLPRDLALRLASQTLAGASLMVIETGEHPAQLRDNVTSPGGTTIAGLEALEKNGIRFALMSAVRAATERSRELGA